jgi:hypothetical protein
MVLDVYNRTVHAISPPLNLQTGPCFCTVPPPPTLQDFKTCSPWGPSKRPHKLLPRGGGGGYFHVTHALCDPTIYLQTAEAKYNSSF